MGAAMKIDDEVPITMPKRMTMANSFTAPVATRASGIVARNVVKEVLMVRFKVSLIDRSINWRNGIALYFRKFSRTRS